MCDVGYSVPVLVFLGLSVLDLGPIYATDRRASSLNTPYPRGGGIINNARCTHAAAHLQSIAYTPYACRAQRALSHEYS